MSMYLEEIHTNLFGIKQGKSVDFYKECLCRSLQNLQGNYDIKQCLQLQSSVSGKKC